MIYDKTRLNQHSSRYSLLFCFSSFKESTKLFNSSLLISASNSISVWRLNWNIANRKTNSASLESHLAVFVFAVNGNAKKCRKFRSKIIKKTNFKNHSSPTLYQLLLPIIVRRQFHCVHCSQKVCFVWTQDCRILVARKHVFCHTISDVCCVRIYFWLFFTFLFEFFNLSNFSVNILHVTRVSLLPNQ